MAKVSSERKRLLTQATRGFAQRHPDETIKSINVHIAEAIGLSSASVEKWRGGYPIAEEYVPALAEWAIRQAGMDRQWLRSFLRHCDFVDDELEHHFFGSGDIPFISLLREACQAANSRLWGDKRLKSAADLHLLRAGPLNLVKSFLISDRPGLILVGASGLGKTSFALRIATGEVELSRPVLVYPATLLDGSRSLTELVFDGLQPHLQQNAARDRESLLSWPILVIFDGVNESPEMVRLTWQIDRGLIDTNGLKVMLTFRPESFQIIQHSLTLTKHCYFDESAPISPKMGLEFASPAFQLLPFTSNELIEAYELYFRVYALKTPYTALKLTLRQVLGHPLTLQLVSQAYSGSHLPDQINTDQLVQLVLDALITNGRLQRTDIHFLEDYLMPLMIAPGYWSNSISAEQMALVRAPNNQRLVQVGEPGALTRLADAGLLNVSDSHLNNPLRFAHERFFEYFAWRRLGQLRAEAIDAHTFYSDLATVPFFLFGSTRRLLAEEIAKQPIGWLVKLLHGTNQPIHDQLVRGALEDWARAHPEEAHTFLNLLWRTGQSHFANTLSWLGLPDLEPKPNSLQLQRIAVLVAVGLGDEDLVVRFLLNGGQTVQLIAAGEVIRLWRTDREVGYRIVAQIVSRVTKRWLHLPNVAAILAFFQLTMLILSEFGDQSEVIDFIRDQTQVVIRRIFGPPWRMLLLHAVMDVAMRRMEHDARESGIEGTLDSVLFHLSPEQRRHLNALVPFLNWETPGISSAYEHILATLNTGDGLAQWFVNIPLIIRGRLGQAETNKLLLALLQECNSFQLPPPWTLFVHWIVADILRYQPSVDLELLDTFSMSLSRVVGSYPHWHEVYRATRIRPPQRLLNATESLGPYFIIRELAQLPIEEGPVWDIVAAKFQASDTTFILDYLKQMRYVAREHRRPRLALLLIRPLLNCTDEIVQRALSEFLARIKAIAAEDVREELIAAGVQPALVAMIEVWQAKDLPDELPFVNTWDLFIRLMIKSGNARQILRQVLSQATRFRSMRDWTIWTMQYILNTLADQQLFPTTLPDD